MIKLLYKEKNVSSFQKIKSFAKNNNIKKIGHTGTLDPIAEGLLLIATEDDTKLIPYIDTKYKSYIATMQLGISSTTWDVDGILTKNNLIYHLNELKILKAFEKFNGFYDQKPPIFSAKKINGQRAYKLARENKEITLKKQKVEIKNLKLLNFNFENQTIEFSVTVSRGTYIRSLIQDIAKELNVIATMSKLLRYEINDLTLSDLEKTELNPLELIKEKKHFLNLQDLKILIKGQNVKIDENINENHIFLVYKKNIVGLAIIKNGYLKSKKLFGKKIERILKDEKI
ncbi:tRNA pseudouridine(55) synthase TruB [Mesomycoplasma neurolyticum]|uniref:tRNA pseudouridine synthase B n=1 Tax=Mesomycoplasma neurolyticum TaxID=2120 RepID=A0A449A5E1_9BACT|nr:tRNA pseudouridine(55) synthase TruB [Mesomycoplasma neurolyticum]VEU59465.1 tRNA pseudouridine synthase B [Mesomycoplasma neurolyticum]